MPLQLDMDKVANLVQDGYVSCRPHPYLPIRIYNYTPRCQYSWKWTKETINCRGLILDDKDNVIARPFPKFFTYDQYKGLRNYVHNLYGVKYKDMFTGPFTTTYKIDGSLGILWEYEGQRGIATRGSFTSEQAVRGTSLLTSLNYPFDTELYTYLFEIVYPENRIVVDYGDKEELVFLTAINKDSGMDDIEEQNKYHWYLDLPSVQSVYFANIDNVLSCESSDGEGFVLLFDNGIRVKHKFSEYIRLSRLMTGLSVQSILELLKHKQSVEELLSVVPDEFHDWIQSIVTEFKLRYIEVFMDAYGVFEKERTLSRKDIAIKHKDYKYKHVVFMLLDGKNPYELIYDIIKKEYEDAQG